MKIKAKGLTVSSESRKTGSIYFNKRIAKKGRDGLAGLTHVGYTKKYQAAICQLKDEKCGEKGVKCILKSLKSSRSKIEKGLVHKFTRTACREISQSCPGMEQPEKKLAYAVLNIKGDAAKVYTLGGCRVYLFRNGALLQGTRENDLEKLRRENPELFDEDRLEEPGTADFGKLQVGDMLVMLGYELENEISDFELSRLCGDIKDKAGLAAALAACMKDKHRLADFTLATAEIF